MSRERKNKNSSYKQMCFHVAPIPGIHFELKNKAEDFHMDDAENRNLGRIETLIEIDHYIFSIQPYEC